MCKVCVFVSADKQLSFGLASLRWNYGTSEGGMRLWKDRVVFLRTESVEYNHIAIYFIV